MAESGRKNALYVTDGESTLFIPRFAFDPLSLSCSAEEGGVRPGYCVLLRVAKFCGGRTTSVVAKERRIEEPEDQTERCNESAAVAGTPVTVASASTIEQ